MATELGKAYVQIVPSAQGIKGSISKTLGPEANVAGEKAGGSIASKLKGAIVKAGIGIAIAKVVKDGVAAGGNLEQSIGGIETLFGAGGRTIEEYAKKTGKSVRSIEGEYNKMMKAQEIALSNADKAYSTVGISANDYMQNVTGFAASLKQSLGGDVVKAANIADMAMVDMADNANKMGTDMGSIQNAYQGFAKQNYTMLDNLKLGYGGTKTEMERLLKDAQKFSGVKYDINNLADVYEAVHVIQGELDITGTTAKEASETIQGSASAMKASFENLLGKIAIGENIESELQALARTVSTFLFKNLIPMVTRILGALPGAIIGFIQEAAPLFIQEGGKLIASLGQGITDGLPMLMEKGVALITGLVSGLKAGMPTFVESAQNLITSLLSSIATNLPKLIDSGLSLVGSLISGLIQAIPLIGGAALDIVSHLVSELVAHAPKLLSEGQKIIGNIVAGISSKAPQVLSTIGRVVSDLLNKLSQDLPLFLQKGTQFIVNMINGIASKAPSIISKLVTVISDLISTIGKNLPQFLSKGAEIIGKMIFGIGQALPKIVTAIMNLAIKLVRALIQNMPKFLKAGLDLILGLGKGILQGGPKIIGSIPGFLGGIVKAFAAGLSGFVTIGRDIVSGLWKGISGAAGWIKEKIGGFASGIVNKVKGFFKIKSPSRVFRDEIGSMLGKGLGLGILDEVNYVSGAMDKLEDEALRDMSASYNLDMSKSLGSNGNTLNYKPLDEGIKEGRESLTLNLLLGNREFRAFVEDITKQQDKNIELGLAF